MEGKLIKTKYELLSINNRRYLGNKYKLLPFIRSVVAEHCKNIEVVADIFSGTGSVASCFADKVLITNDIMYSNYICNYAWFSPEVYDREKISTFIKKYNNINFFESNYMTINFSDTFFSKEDCSKIGYIREDIENNYTSGIINYREKALLIMSLIYAMDKVANTCGHYDAYIKGQVKYKEIKLSLPLVELNNCMFNQCFNQDANDLVRKIYADLVYIDPPYNSRQYCDAYHLLENVARWEKPEVFGVARKFDRTNLKSEYCTRLASSAFEDLIKNIDAKYILFSYNNMAKKGNDRSNAKISDDEIIRILEAKGKVKVFEEAHKAFSTGKSEIKDNIERLFLCECDEYNRENFIFPKKEVTSRQIDKKNIIPSPLNYIGGKHRLLPQILPFFPKKIKTCVDLFCGGCSVGINVNAEKVVFNDNNKSLIELLKLFQRTKYSVLKDEIYKVILSYGLTDSANNGYSFYKCNSSDGFSKYNKEAYLNLRNHVNEIIDKNGEYYLLLYVLIVFAFNNQIRFNSLGKFNLPVGKRDFNKKMQRKLEEFTESLKNSDKEIIFKNKDFRELKSLELNKNDFVYIDPPYLITCATYNEQNMWTEVDEHDLLKFIDNLNANGIKFAFSNVLESKGKENHIIKKWLEENKDKYIVHHLNYSYSNSNYRKKDKEKDSDEVLIVNYRE